MPGPLQNYLDKIDSISSEKIIGKVEKVVGLTIESRGPKASVGEICKIQSEQSKLRGYAEVVGFRDNHLILMPLGAVDEVKMGDEVLLHRKSLSVPASDKLLGRILDGLGNPIDGLGEIESKTKQPVYNNPPNPLERTRIKEQMETGIRAIDVFNTCGKGQRTGIFAGSGVGKSVLLGMIARNTKADINVIALIGERGREVREFIERDLGTEGLKRSVVIVVTSDQPALLKIKGILVASAIAEYFRDKSMDVMFLADSLTRVAMAQREVGLAIGELPTSKGYTPSVFSLLPKIVERAGYSDKGSITGFYTVLVEGDEMDDPVADAVRSYIDGHIVLSRKLAHANRYPAISILDSASRLMTDVASGEHRIMANSVRNILATYQDAEDIINIGAYVRGNNPAIDQAIELYNPLINFLQQGVEEKSDISADLTKLAQILQLDMQEQGKENEQIQI